MRFLGAVLVLAVVVVGCTSGALPPAEMERPTYEENGFVYFETDCPQTASWVRGGGQDAAPGLPTKGLTSLERVESLLPAIRAAYPEISEVRLIFRNGEVRAGPSFGSRTAHPEYTVEAVADYQYEIVLAADATCPDHAVRWHGIPLLYNRS